MTHSKRYSHPSSKFNSSTSIPTRKILRKNETYAEKILWKHLRDKQLGSKFRRQQAIGRYIADFYCAEFSLVVEVDGDSHFSEEAIRYDQERDKFLCSLNLNVLRFTNDEVIKNISGVIERISEALG